jgi:shikimate dehydrogenase
LSKKGLTELVSNPLTIQQNIKYSSIIGLNPSQGARSPSLWNKAFKGYGISCQMYPMDTKPEHLEKLLDFLNSDSNYIGGAVTAPYKEKVRNWLKNNVSDEAKSIGSVNCLFRNAFNMLEGTNTDGKAALQSLTESSGDLNNKKILLIGLGGAGKSVSTFIAGSIKNKENLMLASRSDEAIKYAKKISANSIPWSEIKSHLKETSILINCTSLGSGDLQNHSPISDEELSLLPKGSVVYDINYINSPSLFLRNAAKLGYKTLDGTTMNIYQAVIAFNLTTHKNDIQNTLSFMKQN